MNQEFAQKILSWTKTNPVPLTIILINCLFLFLTILGYSEVKSIQPKSVGTGFKLNNNRQLKANIIFVDVEGAAEQPGVYQLPSEARLVELIRKANGLHNKVDRYYLAKNFNLAKKLADEEKIYLPFLVESTYSTIPLLNEKKISLNSASLTELELLPGIGQITASRIITNRPYQELAELTNKKIVSQSVFNKISSQIEL
jgi:competence protein ComEA